MNTVYHFRPGMAEKVTWFTDSPRAGDPKCVCSYCRNPIVHGELPVRSRRQRDNAELRLHILCAVEVIKEFTAGRKV